MDRHEISKQGKDKRFKRTDEQRHYSVRAVWEKHHEVLRRIVLGQKNVDIAKDLHCTPQMISDLRNSPLGKEVLKVYMQERDEEVRDMRAQIDEFAPVALSYLEDVITGAAPGVSPALRARTAENYVSRAGYGTVTRVQTLHATVSRGEIEQIKQRALELASRSGQLVHRTERTERSAERVEQTAPIEVWPSGSDPSGYEIAANARIALSEDD